jgi:hypothetical protein
MHAKTIFVRENGLWWGPHGPPLMGYGLGWASKAGPIAHCGLGYGLGAWAHLWAMQSSIRR